MVDYRGSGTGRRRASMPLALILLLGAPAIQAEPVQLSAGINNRFSDNMRQSADNEQSDIETRFNVRAYHQSDPGRLNTQLSADLGYGYWYDDTFDPELYTTLDFRGDYEIANRFYWDVSNNLRDVIQDSRENNTPDNSTRKNVFSTGPRYILPLGRRDSLTFSARYENTDFEEPEDPDSDRYFGDAAWNHIFSPTLSGGLSYRATRTELDTGEEIDLDTASVNFDKSWLATRLSGSVGISEIESRFQGRSQTSDGFVGNVNLERDINPSTSAYVNASRELTDQTSDFDIEFEGFSFNLRETTTVEVTALRAGVRRVFSDGSLLTTELSSNRSDYLQTGETEESTGLTVGYSRPVTNLVNFNAGGRYFYQSYEQEDSQDDLYGLDVGLSYTASRRLSLVATVGHNARRSDFDNREFSENFILLGLDYRFL